MALRSWGFSTRVAVRRGATNAVFTALATLALLAALTAPGARAAGPGAVAARVGAAPAMRRIPLVLPLRVNAAALQRFATAVSTPGSPEYGRYESITELTRRFGAPAAERGAVLRFLRRAGARSVSIDGTGLFARAR